MKLIKYLKPYWFAALMTPLFIIIEVVVDLFQPKLMSKIVDEGVLGGNIGFLTIDKYSIGWWNIHHILQSDFGDRSVGASNNL